MYISRIRIRNYRCFSDSVVEFQPGLNVIIGENNAGKTTLLRALALVFGRRGRGRPTAHDFHCLLEPRNVAPTITIEATLRSSKNDTQADRALVASWLTKLDGDWEASLTYSFFLPEQHHKEFSDELARVGTDNFFDVVEEFLPKYVSRIYGGNPATLVPADSESLAKFDCQFLDALRDVESEMFEGGTPLFRDMLEKVLDLGKDPEERRVLRSSFRLKSNALREELVTRLDKERLFKLVVATGAADGGNPALHGGVAERDLIAALRLFISREKFSFPATHNGLGFNNLIYISLVLASLSFQASEERRGQNAAIFPMLLIEEPEAHLHPALQYKLLSHIRSRVEAEPHQNRQVFVTTHSTHITAASRLEPIICVSLKDDGSIGVSYPARVFADNDEGKESKSYVERYLDATKSAMLFAKATVFVEGITEQLVVPALALAMNRSFDEHHVAVIRVDGVTFKHFLPLFGAGVEAAKVQFAIERRVACIIDADPARRDKQVKRGGRRKCFPFQLNRNVSQFEYFPVGGAVTNLQELQKDRDCVAIFHSTKTFEYDLALTNSSNADLVTTAMENHADLRQLAASPTSISDALRDLLDQDEHDSLAAVTDSSERCRQLFAAMYLRCAQDCKGEHAFALEQHIRSGNSRAANRVACPEYIKKAIEWVTPFAAPVAKP